MTERGTSRRWDRVLFGHGSKYLGRNGLDAHPLLQRAVHDGSVVPEPRLGLVGAKLKGARQHFLDLAGVRKSIEDEKELRRKAAEDEKGTKSAGNSAAASDK